MGILSARIRRQRMLMAAPYIRGAVLDLGCGEAAMLELFGDRMESYTGVEQAPGRARKLAKRHPGHVFVHRDLDDDPLGFDAQFDVALLIAVVEHVYNQKHLFREVVRALKPDGRIVITTPTPFGNDVAHRIGARLGLFSPGAAEDHVVIYNRRRFEILARDFGLELERYQRFQCGCNQLAVLRRKAPDPPPEARP